MQHWVFRDFVTAMGRNLVREWLDGLPPAAKANINVHIRLCEVTRPLRRPMVGLLSGGDCGGLIELRVKVQNIAYRPLAYYGPEKGDITLLFGATERDGAFAPPDACRTAASRRGLIESGGGTTCDHDFG
jgi:hypothetical protein